MALVVLLGASGAPSDALDAALSRLGARLVRASSEAELESALAGSEPALVLIEPSLPGLDPAALVARLRSEPRALPPIALSLSAGTPPPAGDPLAAFDRIDPLGVSPLEPHLALYLDLWRTLRRSARQQRQLELAEAQLHSASLDGEELSMRFGACQGELASATEQLVQAGKLAMLGELVVGVAHELNNPLAFALSQLGTARRGLSRRQSRPEGLASQAPDDLARLDARLDGVREALERIRTLVVRLQSFARLDEGAMLDVDVPAALAAVLAMLEHRHGGRVQVRVELGEPHVLHCHPGLIDQCVANLIVNALDAIEGEGSLHIRGGAESERYVLSVTDSGQGILPEVASRIFEPFFTTKPRGKGTGLGLSIASAIVRRHGGTLRLEPAAEGGTRATLSIPLPSPAPQLG